MGGLKLVRSPKISLSKYFLVNEEIFNAKSSMEEDEKKIRGARENTINLCRIGGARYGGA